MSNNAVTSGNTGIDHVLASLPPATNKADLPLKPKQNVLWIMCMDPRVDPSALLGLQLGDAGVVRNAGGRFADAERSIMIAQTFGAREIAFVHHSDCGMLRFTDESIRQKLHDELHLQTDGVDFLPFTDVHQSIKEDLAAYKQSPRVLQNVPVRGFYHDLKTGTVTEVHA